MNILAVRHIIRLYLCAKRAEDLLYKISGGSWSVSIKTGTIQATQRKTKRMDLFACHESWLRFEVSSNGATRLDSGHRIIAVVPGLDFEAIAFQRHQQQDALTKRVAYELKVVTVMRRVLACAMNL